MKIIVKAVAGSHLFGLNTPTSDKDYKGVYMPDTDDILLGKVKRSINTSTNKSSTKNGADDIDMELYSLHKFLKMLQEGQTVAMELLFTPDHLIIEKHPIWDEIVAMRDQLVHKKVTAFIGYAKTQANKYGIKGSRMNSMKGALDLLIDNSGADKLHDIWDKIVAFTDTQKHSSIMNLPANKNMVNKDIPHWEVCGKKFDRTVGVDYMRGILTTIYDNYGDRAKQAAKDQGVDWKAISHALRVMHQGKVLLETGSLSFPLEDSARDFILSVKKGEIPFKKVQPILELWMDNLEEAERLTHLQDSISTDEIILKYYRQEILNENND